MSEQLHKRLSEEQVKMILDRYVKKELGSEQAMNLLGLKRSQFFELVKKYRLFFPVFIRLRRRTLWCDGRFIGL